MAIHVGTLADRLLEVTGTIPESRIDKYEVEKNEQVLDTLKGWSSGLAHRDAMAERDA